MKNTTHKHSHEIQLSFMGFGTPNPPDCLDDINQITKAIDNKWEGIKSFCISFGDQLRLILKIKMPKVIFDLSFINKYNHKVLSCIDYWDDYRTWKKRFLKGTKTYAHIPKFVYLAE